MDPPFVLEAFVGSLKTACQGFAQNWVGPLQLLPRCFDAEPLGDALRLTATNSEVKSPHEATGKKVRILRPSPIYAMYSSGAHELTAPVHGYA